MYDINTYQIELFNQGKTCVFTLCVHLIQVIVLQGIVLFQSLKFYDDDLLVLDVIDDFELSVAVVNESVYYISRYILSNFKQFADLD